MDADAGLGLVSAPMAMELAIKRLHRRERAGVAIQNSNHFGIAGYHAMKALHDMIRIYVTNASHWWLLLCRRRGCWAPIPSPLPFLRANSPFARLETFATTTAANENWDPAAENQQAPYGWSANQEGEPSTNPSELKQEVRCCPLGGDREHGSHKGFMLGSIVDILSGVYHRVPTLGPGCRHFPLMCRCRSLCRAKA